MLRKSLLASLFFLSACSQGDTNTGIASSSGYAEECTSRTNAKIGGPISLINQDGIAVTKAHFADRYSLVFFGFTYCPDVCPFTLNKLKHAIDNLPDDVEKPRTILISVDPERDTPEALKTYLSNEDFPEISAGLTGSDEQVTEAAASFVAYYKRIEAEISASGYTMSHSSFIYMMDKDWKLKTFFTHDARPDEMTRCMATFLPKAG